MNKKIVIVDDEPITRMDIKDILQAEGYNVVGEAADGFDAIEACKKHRPDIVLMDIQMPVLDGLKASKKIMSENLAGGILLLTAFSDAEYIEKAKSVGAFGYLVKPLDEKSLISTLEMCLARGEDFRNLKDDLEKLNKKFDERKVVEKAKGMLMLELKITEDEAYKRIRKLSMDKRCSMAEIAQTILINYE
ncbi:MAG: response regulator [Clostridiaceae bacterium]